MTESRNNFHAVINDPVLNLLQISEEAMNPSVDEPASLEETHPWMKHVGVWMRGNERKREITPIEELSEGGTPERTRSHTSAKSEK